MSIKKISAIVLAVSAACGFQSATAEELVVTSAKSKSGNSIAIDLITEGSAVAFQFNIPLPKGVAEKDVDLSNCVADLPSTHSGQCSVAKGQVIGLVYNDANVALPAGLVSVGRIGINSPASARGKLSVAYFEVNDSAGRALPVKTSVSSEK